MGVSAIITHYWSARASNLPVIVEALQTGTCPPDEILIWNNDRVPIDPRAVEPARVIQSSFNIGAKARFAAALCAAHEWILFHDNDLQVQPETVARLLDYPIGCIVSLAGRRLIANQPYSASLVIDGARIYVPQPIDISNGRLEMVEKRIVRELISDMPFDATMVMDDIYFSAAARLMGVPRVVLPYGPRQGFTNLSDGNVGSCVGERAARHYAERNHLVSQLFL